MRAGTELFKELKTYRKGAFPWILTFAVIILPTTCFNFTPKTDTPCFSLKIEWDCHRSLVLHFTNSYWFSLVFSIPQDFAFCCPVLPNPAELSCRVLSVPSCIAVVARRGSATWAVLWCFCFPWKNPTLTSSQSTKR